MSYRQAVTVEPAHTQPPLVPAEGGFTVRLANFTGPFDRVMAFAFYLPNLVVAEAYIRSQGKKAPAALRLAASAVMLGAAFLLLVGTYYFCRFYWIPGIAMRFAG